MTPPSKSSPPSKSAPLNPTRVPTTRERLLLGQACRKQVKRQAHAEWKPSDRKQDPQQLIRASTRDRVPSLVTLKNERMACSPFAYFRGAVPVMAYDLSLIPNTGLHTQLCGDAHVRNLGAFAGPDGRLVFDINDFDETIPGPFEWDLKRMATSLILAGREAGVGNGRCTEAAAVFLAQYREMMHLFTRMPILDVVRFQVHRLGEVGPVSTILAAAQRSTPLHSLTILTEPVPKTSPDKMPEGRPHRIFKTEKPVLWRLPEAEAAPIVASLKTYAGSLQPERAHFLDRYRILGVGFKVVGTGSVGLRDYCLYLEGNGSKDPLFLQIKEEPASAYAPYLPEAAARFSHQGRRVVEGERAMQIQSDPFLGWTSIPDAKTGKPRDFLVRQLNDYKASLDLTTLKPSALMEYAKVSGEIFARGHARSGDFAMLAGYIGASERFDEAIVKFAKAYADQTEKDFERHVKELKKQGKLPTA